MGWSGSPVTLTARPSSTVTCIAQVSGQSCGQAPRTKRVAMSRSYAGLDRLTTPEGAAKGDLVRVLEVRAHRQSAREARDGDLGRALTEGIGEVEGGGFAGGGGVRGDHDLTHAGAVVDSSEQLGDVEVLG